MTDLPTPEGFLALARAGKLAQRAGDPKGPIYLDGNVLEPKYDGWRVLIFRDADRVRVFVRNGGSYTGRIPAIEREILARFPAGTWIDGEVVADEGWGTVQSVMTTQGWHVARERVTFMAFDLLALKDIDARRAPLAHRRALLEQAVGDKMTRVKVVEQVPATREAHERFFATPGLEGSIVKNPDASYASAAKGRGWTKWKPQDTDDVVVMGFEPGKGGMTGLVGAIVFGKYIDGTLTRIGTCSGFDMRTRIAMTENPERYVGNVIEIGHFEPTKDGGDKRSPQFKRWRTDKPAAECVAA